MAINRQQQGFTLIEALIVTAILASVLALSYQMVSVFWRASNHSTSNFAEAQQDFYFQLAFKGSVNSMYDYYTQESNWASTKLYFEETSETLRFVSSHSVLGFENLDVAVLWRIDNEAEPTTIMATECPLNKVLITKRDEFPEHESCRQQSILTSTQSWRFSSVPFKPAAELDDSQQQTQRSYRLPRLIRLQAANGKVFEFTPKVVNTSKWFLMRRQTLSGG